MSFIKEKKVILSSITKFASEAEVLAEVKGYQHAQKSGLHTAKLLHWSENAISVEYISGISCFYLLHLYGELRSFENSRNMLRLLVDDINKFQSTDFETDLFFYPYPIREKVAEIVNVMDMVNHSSASKIRDKALEIENTFMKYAKFPFRDANPKNTLMSGVTTENFNQFLNGEISNLIRHIDFRSVSELTTRYDDLISAVYHYHIPDAIRLEFLDMNNVDQKSEEYLATLFVRLGRFWSRRMYYRIVEPDLFKKRYSLEDLNFYSSQFDHIVNIIMSL